MRISKLLFLWCIVIMGCSEAHKIDIQGHRGCRGLLPENSLPAFEKAINLGVNTLELDIAITKDKDVIVTHEPFMSKTICLQPNGEVIPDSLDKAFNLYKMSYDEIKAFDCGTKFHDRFPNQEKMKVHKPLLSEVFELAKTKGSDVKFNIEIKSKPEYYGIYTPEPDEYVSIVLKTIKDHGMFDRSNLQSFDLNIIRQIRTQDAEMKIALLIDEDEDIWGKITQVDNAKLPEIISPYYKLLDSTVVRNLRAEGFQVIPWTINDVTDMQQMIDWTVDGIITDYPDRLITLLQN